MPKSSQKRKESAMDIHLQVWSMELPPIRISLASGERDALLELFSRMSRAYIARMID